MTHITQSLGSAGFPRHFLSTPSGCFSRLASEQPFPFFFLDTQQADSVLCILGLLDYVHRESSSPCCPLDQLRRADDKESHQSIAANVPMHRLPWL